MKPKIIKRRTTYAEWFARVNTLLIKDCGWGINDLPDYCYKEAYDAGDTPSECMRDVIKNAEGY